MSSVLMIDNHFLLRQGLKEVLAQEFRGITFGEAGTAAEIASRFRKRSWDLAVIHLELSDGQGFPALLQVHQLSPETRILVVTNRADAETLARVVEFGASALVEESCERAVLVKAFHNLIAGRKYFPNGAPAASDQSASPRHAQLSPRELEIMLAIASGARPSLVAKRLEISVQTVSTYRRRIFDKMGFSSTADLIRYVLETKLS